MKVLSGAWLGELGGVEWGGRGGGWNGVFGKSFGGCLLSWRIRGWVLDIFGVQLSYLIRLISR